MSIPTLNLDVHIYLQKGNIKSYRGSCEAAEDVPALCVGFQEYAVDLLRFEIPYLYRMKGERKQTERGFQPPDSAAKFVQMTGRA
jgi:hypothetical protein